MSKENCKGIKCAYCLEDPVCCNGNYHPLIDESFCNTCMNATKCYETYFPVISCSEYVPDVPQAASAPRHIDVCKLFNNHSLLSLKVKRGCK